MSSEVTLSYSHGASASPLLGETIGANLRRIAAAHPDAEVLVDVPTGRRWTYAAVRRGDRYARPRPDRGRARGRRPGGHLGAELRRVGAAAVRDRQGRHHPGQHQPGVPQPRARLRAAPVRRPGAGQRRALQDQRLPGDDRGGQARPDRPGARDLPRHASAGTRCCEPGRQRTAPTTRWPSARPACRSTTRSTSSTRAGRPASRRARRCRTTTSSTTRSSSARAAGTPQQDRVCIPVPFYHCFGMVLGNLACTTHGACIVIPAPGFDPAADAARGPGRAVHVAVRGADHVHRRARAARLRQLRPVDAAHRHHGRVAVPGRGDEAGRQRDAHDRGHDLLRDDRDVAGLDPDHGRRRHGAPGLDRRPGAPARRGQGHRPGDRAGAAPRARRASCARAATR